MTVTLQVSDVRRELYWAGGGPESAGNGEPSHSLLGRMFHDIFADLVGGDPNKNLWQALAQADRNPDTWPKTLIEHAYADLVGPRLSKQQSLLQEKTAEVLSFWQAVEAACEWLAELCRASEELTPRANRKPEEFPLGIAVEEPLSWELREPGWTDGVRLVGISDAVFRIRGREPWCVVEWKLGRTTPEIDLAQACLYHEMLRSAETTESANDQAALAVVSFLPEVRERLFQSQELAEAQQRLKNLIGRLANVLPDAGPKPPPNVPPKKPPEKDHRSPSPEQIDQGRQLVATYDEYQAPLQLAGEPIAGPTFLRYPVVLGHGVKLSAVKSRAHDVQMRLGLAEPPQINLTGGQVVIDIQRPDRQFVLFSGIADQLPAPDPLLGCSKVPIGINLDGELQFADLAESEHCHLLVAGTTGSGKSEWLRSAVAGLLATNTPETLQLVLIDPKRNAFWELRESPFLRCPIVYPDEHSVPDVLAELVEEMEARYAVLEGADSISRHVQRIGKPIPRIVCICDEYYAVVHGPQGRKAIEQHIFALGAKARAAGIHLVLATQQPSREIVKGALDANIPARVGLKTAQSYESTMLLGERGTEHLLGNGDLLFKAVGLPERLQSPYLPEAERTARFGPPTSPTGRTTPRS